MPLNLKSMQLSLGDKIRLLRTMKGYSQKGLALSAGLRQENISYVESNKNRKPLCRQLLERIAAALHMSVEEIEYFEPVGSKQAAVQEAAKQLQPTDPGFIIALQKETINMLQLLNENYRLQLSNNEY
ncbi:MAG: helix-turn-helix transcriptional regulator [Ferruginibacter sp.]